MSQGEAETFARVARNVLIEKMIFELKYLRKWGTHPYLYLGILRFLRTMHASRIKRR